MPRQEKSRELKNFASPSWHGRDSTGTRTLWVLKIISLGVLQTLSIAGNQMSSNRTGPTPALGSHTVTGLKLPMMVTTGMANRQNRESRDHRASP